MPSRMLPKNATHRLGREFWVYDEEYIARRMRRLEKRFPEGVSVDFMIAGVQKGGSTALEAYLRPHPELCFGRRKEIHFFDTPELFEQGTPDYRLYHAYFHPEEGQRLLAEATPDYVYAEGAIERIHAYNPRAKIVTILRNPIDRAYSHWNMSYTKQHETLPFREALEAETQADGRRSYMDRGFYSRQIARLRQHFPEEQLLILRQEDLSRDPNAVLSRIWTFLGVEPMGPVEPEARNVGTYTGRMSDADRDYLRGVFNDEIHTLEAMLGWDCSNWMK